MTVPPRSRDLTRWNRAGLERFRYVDGNAITHLEHLRERLAEAFPDPIWAELHKDLTDERTGRIVEQYNGRRRDWAWEIARSFARATHVLTEHLDAFANEGFLGTATQWEYLRRLVAMIDYRPAPPASASTTLALIAKENGKGLVQKGFQVKHTPQNGGPPVVFETLEDVEIDPALNGLRLRGWNDNPERFDPFASLEDDAPAPWILPEDAEISVGQLGVLTASESTAARRGRELVAVKVDDISEAKDAVAVEAVSGLSTLELVRGDVELHLAPDDVIAPRLNGADVATFVSAHGLTAGAVVGWRRSEVLGFARVVATDEFSLQLTDVMVEKLDTSEEPDIGAAGTEFFIARSLSQEQYQANGGEWRLPLETNMPTSSEFRIAPLDRRGRIGSDFLTESDLEEAKASDHEFGNEFRRPKTDPGAHSLRFFDPVHDDAIGTSVDGPSLGTYDFGGAPAGLASGDYMVAEDDDIGHAALRIQEIEESEDSFRLIFENAPIGLNRVARLHGPFKLRLSPRGHDRNPINIDPGALILDLADEVIPEALSSGRTVIVEPEEPAAGGAAFKATMTEVIDAVEGTAPTFVKTKRGRFGFAAAGNFDIVRNAPSGVRIKLDAPVSAYDGYTVGGLVIRANAVALGHGETKPEIALGSGAASTPSQSFVLAKGDISFVADPMLEAGVRAAVDIVADGRRYEEVSSFANSEPGDAHYTVRFTEGAHLQVTFGDGYHGRRLPTGRNNVNVAYRVGVGSGGNNLAPASLEKPVRPHNLIASVRQPLFTSGGQEAEPLESVRQLAPAHLRSLGRAVSLADYEYLAESQPGVWSAKAYENSEGAGRAELIELAVVPTDGGALGDLQETLEERFVNLGLPGLTVRIERFDEVPLPLEVTLRVDSNSFDPSEVEAKVRAALYEVLKLEARAPGQPLYRAEIFRIVEAVEGVANSDVYLFARRPEPLLSVSGAPLRPSSRSQRDDVWAVWPTNRQVVYAPHADDLVLTTSEAFL